MNERDVTDAGTEDAAFARRFRQAYERTASRDSAASAVAAAVRAAPRPRRRRGLLETWIEPRTISFRPVVAAAFGLVLLALGGLVTVRFLRPTHEAGEPAGSIATAAGEQQVRFVLVAPASTVALVGDFNNWDVAATPMTRDANGVWTATLRLEPGWHAYAFVVDGSRWVHDPRAPRAPADDFGVPRSVVVVGGRGT